VLSRGHCPPPRSVSTTADTAETRWSVTIPFSYSPRCRPERLNDLCALLLRTPVAAATVRDETALEVIGSRTAVAEQTARRLDDRNKESPSIRTAEAHLEVLDYREQLTGRRRGGWAGYWRVSERPTRSEQPFKPDNARCTISLRPAHACTRRFDELVGAGRRHGDECRRSHGTCEEVRRCPMP